VADIAPTVRARRTGRKAGFALYPLSDCFAA